MYIVYPDCDFPIKNWGVSRQVSGYATDGSCLLSICFDISVCYYVAVTVVQTDFHNNALFLSLKP